VNASGERPRVEDTLRRIDDLVTGLAHISDPTARESARELLEAILDLHGLAVARIMAAVAAAADGKELLTRFVQDEQIKAVLLLYGLHPEDPETRLRQALAILQPRLDEAGVAVRIGRVTAKGASVRISGDPAGAERLRQEIEEAIVNAVPDLDEIAIDWEDAEASRIMSKPQFRSGELR
jgi:hypothetical protein